MSSKPEITLPPQLEEQAKRLQELYEEYLFNPLAWVREILGMKPTKQQVEYWTALGKLLRAKFLLKYGTADQIKSEHLERYTSKKGIALPAGKGVGKDGAGAATIAYFIDVWHDAKIICTAPGEDQLKTITWPEVKTWVYAKDEKTQKAKCCISDNYDIGATTIFNKMTDKKKGFAFMKVAQKNSSEEMSSKTFDGLHAPVLVFVVTEADGVTESVFMSMDSTMTGDLNLAILLYNPTRTTGYAYRAAFDPDESANWVVLNWNAEDSELVSKAAIERAARHGRDSNYYRVFVLGLPPNVEKDALIPIEWIMLAKNRELEVPPELKGCLGIDPAGMGHDRTCMTPRYGGRVDTAKIINNVRSAQIMDEIEEFATLQDPAILFMDTNGVGTFLFPVIQKKFMNCRSIVSQGEARDKSRFANKRAELYWTMREAFENGLLSIPNDSELIEELACIKWKRNDKGLIQIEPKDDIKRRLRRSPDKADSLSLTFDRGFNYISFRPLKEDEAAARLRKLKALKNIKGKKTFMGA